MFVINHAGERVDPLELLEELRTDGTGQADKLDIRTLDALARNASKLAADCVTRRGEIKAAAAAARDEPTTGQRRDLDKLEAARTEYTALGRELHQLAERANQKAKADYAEQIRRGEVSYVDDELGQEAVTGTGYHSAGGNVYRADDVRRSWVRDLVSSDLRGDPEASARLRRNNVEVSMESRALSTTDGAGGDWVPPLWLISEGIRLARSSRVIADQVTAM